MISSSLDGIDTLRDAAILPARSVWKVELVGIKPE
jgi:hypothetical protein